MFKSHEGAFSTLQKTIDAGIVLVSWGLAYYIRFNYLPDAQSGLFELFAKLSIALVLITLWSYYKNGLYSSRRFSNKFTEILSIFKANTTTVLAFVIILYFTMGERISRTTILIYYGISSFLLILTRIIVRNFLRSLRRKGRNLRHILLVGDGPQLLNYINAIARFKDSGLRCLGWIEGNGNEGSFNIPKIDKSLKDAILEHNPDTVVIGYSGEKSEKVDLLLRENYDTVTPIQILPDLSYSMIGHKIEEFAGIPFLLVNHPRFTTLDQFLKRSVDFFGAFIGLIILSPLYFFVSLAVKISSPGPIFYGQERIGLDGKLFKMWKFRSMKVATNNEDSNTWGSKDNPRKTKVGEFIRKTSIDELPQLWNVLVGDMSLIGPRPERPFFVEKFSKEIPNYMLRHKMKAGITGWAQVNGWRGDTSIKIRIEHDIYYIKNWSLWLDIKIIFLTFWKGFINKNAY